MNFGLDCAIDLAAFAEAVVPELVQIVGNCTSQVCSSCRLSQSVAPSGVETAADILDIEVAAVLEGRNSVVAPAVFEYFGRKDSFAVGYWPDLSRGSFAAAVAAVEFVVGRHFGGKAKRNGNENSATVLEGFDRHSAE